MKPSKNTLSISILNQEYQINCPETHQEELRSAAKYLDKKMQETRNHTLTHYSHGNDRIAIITALNICHTLLTHEKKTQATEKTLQQLQKQIEQSLNQSF